MGPAVFLAFAVVGVIVYGLMISYAELLVNLPRKGSFVSYTKEFLGGTLSVGMGWSFWFNWVCYVPSEAIATAIIINNFFPGNTAAYAIGTLAVLTVINLTAVDIFAKIESALALIKVCAIIVFSVIVFLIWIGVWGSSGFLGASVNFGADALTFADQLFPNGVTIVLVSMVIVLVTFQGTEIVGLAAAEAQDPDKSVPRACKSVTIRIVGLYLVPILLILLVFPFGEATTDGSIFADVLAKHDMPFLSAAISAVVLVAAFSCANTGFYGTVRCMFGLSIEGLAPKFLSKLNKKSNPKNAVLFTLIFMWIVLMIGLLAGESDIYESLLSMSGFTGTLAWVGIIASQIVFRRKLRKRGYDTNMLKARVSKAQTWIPWFAMIMQLACLVLLAFGEGQLPVFCLACSAVVVPMIVYAIAKKMGKIRDTWIGSDEKTFEELYPVINK
jgi:AAT family amino acid transporter